MTTVRYMLTRGPLPSSVYWRRRLLLLSLALVLVVVIAELLDHGSSGGGSAAVQVAETGTSTPTAPSPSTSPRAERPRTTPSAPVTSTGPITSAPPSPTTTPTISSTTSPGTGVAPTGQCQAADVVVTPSVRDAVVGEPVTVTLDVHTRTEPACTWRLTTSTLQVKIVSHDTLIWSTADCHRAITPRALPLSTQPTQASLSWNGHLSDPTCSSHALWADQGVYSVTATALGGVPATSTFRIGAPTVIVTVTPTPTPSSPTSSATPGQTYRRQGR